MEREQFLAKWPLPLVENLIGAIVIRIRIPWDVAIDLHSSEPPRLPSASIIHCSSALWFSFF
ncbi:Hypothetical predicted protein [Podarcis lilfordi]|uniref:Uncharacterized protein n=1 Tax=Podarcis lilfordi TaxID=74358 RepID=A0AA35P240_9SAUR|nr:Hypothetical predicted protein [Podarcis lilfordi]